MATPMHPRPGSEPLEHFCEAVSWIAFRGREYPVLPKVVAPYLLVPIVLLALLIFVLEVRLSGLAEGGVVLGNRWQAENTRINQMNSVKIVQRGEDRRWQSAGMPWAEKSAARKRILVVGDSFVWGSGNINANEIWWRQLARELQHRGYWDVEVVALCASGASTEDQLIWLRDHGWLKKAQADIVVFGYVTNDPAIRRGDGFMVRQIGGDVPLPNWSGLDSTLGVVAPNLNVQVKQLLTKKWQSKVTDAYPYKEWELKLLEEPNISAYRAVVRDLASFLTQSQIPHFFVTLPNAPDPATFAPRYAAVRPLFADAGLSFVDLLPDFLQENPGAKAELSWGVNPANGHPGPLSTRFYARRVSDWLEKAHREVLGERSERPTNLRPVINDWMPPEANAKPIRQGTWEVYLPVGDVLAPRLPLERQHVVLSFEHPVAIRSVQVSSDELHEIELHVSHLDPTSRIERSEHVALGARRGASARWLVDPQLLIHTLKIAGRPTNKRSSQPFVRTELVIEFDPLAVRP